MKINRRNLQGLLVLITTIISAPGYAQLNVNMTQANQTGLNLEGLEAIIEAADEIEITLKSEPDDPFNPQFDLIILNATQAQRACENGQLLNLNDKAFAGYQKKKEFLFKTKDDCTVNIANYSMVIAYPLFNMVISRPDSPADLFNIENFPGQRALPDSPIGTLEWALLAYGIPINEVYQLLSTERGLRLAFEKLDSIKKHILWYKNIDELNKLIEDRKPAMAAGPHQVFYDIQFNHPMEILWHGQLLVEMKMGINASSQNIEQSRQLLENVMADSTQFKLAYEYAFGPSNKKTLHTLELLPQSGQLMVFIPTSKDNMEKAIWMDYQWHETLNDIISKRFKAWRNEEE